MSELFAQRYAVVREIGAGGFGTVFLAHDVRLRNRPVALKVLHPGLSSDPGLLRIFELEAGTLASLDHDHIVSVLDAGIWDRRRFIVMRYVDGASLRQLVQTGGPQPPGAARAWLRQAADALAYAHSRGILHRDIKAANLLIESGSQRLYVVDFGLAQAAEISGGSNSVASQALTGTAAYRAPEVARTGHTCAGDLYSLGVVGYELLAGRLPFVSDDPLSLLLLHATEPVPPLPADVPDDLAAVVMRLLAKDPAERPVSARDLIAELEGLGATRPSPVHAYPPSGAPAAEVAPVAAVAAPARAKPVARHLPWLALAGIAVVIALLALLASRFLGPSGERAALAPQVAAVTEVAPATTAPPAATPTPAPTATRANTVAAKPAAAKPAPAATRVPTVEPRPSATLGPGSVFDDPRDGMAQVYIPGGAFLMGAVADDPAAQANERPQRSVELTAFWIDRTEVTNAQYRLCIDAGVCRRPDADAEYLANATYDSYPVVNVTWQDAVTYCAWAGRRLPTEAEWEKAARGTDGARYPWGNARPAADRANLCDRRCEYAWKQAQVDDGFRWAAPVGSYPAGASPYGALDTAGNVWEWVADWYAADAYSRAAQVNPQGPDTGAERIVRGGSWYDHASHLRATRRLNSEPDTFDGNTGFRCARGG